MWKLNNANGRVAARDYLPLQLVPGRPDSQSWQSNVAVLAGSFQPPRDGPGRMSRLTRAMAQAQSRTMTLGVSADHAPSVLLSP